MMVPIYKKGNCHDPNNYRGITLVSCFAKLFNVVVNERLKKWSVEHDKLTDAQVGFKAKYSTVDAIFLLKCFIDKQLANRKKLYCCYIDIMKFFDSIYRNGLWFKLIKSGLDGRLFKVLKSMYRDVKICVKHMGSISEFFNCEMGLLQGEIVSQIFFPFLQRY